MDERLGRPHEKRWAQLIREEGIIANEAPEDDVLEELKAAGKELAE